MAGIGGIPDTGRVDPAGAGEAIRKSLVRHLLRRAGSTGSIVEDDLRRVVHPLPLGAEGAQPRKAGLAPARGRGRPVWFEQDRGRSARVVAIPGNELRRLTLVLTGVSFCRPSASTGQMLRRRRSLGCDACRLPGSRWAPLRGNDKSDIERRTVNRVIARRGREGARPRRTDVPAGLGRQVWGREA